MLPEQHAIVQLIQVQLLTERINQNGYFAQALFQLIYTILLTHNDQAHVDKTVKNPTKIYIITN